MLVFVTGATGVLGRRLVEQFCARGDQVIGARVVTLQRAGWKADTLIRRDAAWRKESQNTHPQNLA
jgi:nucleoside-diphosphate-sugar epimerase